MAAQHDFEIEQGATLLKSFIWKDGDGVPVDLTGYAARMQIRSSIDSDEVLLEASTSNGRIQLDGADGRINLTVSAADTAAIAWKRGKYDIELESASGIVTRLIQGSVTISREVTRD